MVEYSHLQLLWLHCTHIHCVDKSIGITSPGCVSDGLILRIDR